MDGQRTLGTLLRDGRARLGIGSAGRAKPRSFTDEQGAAAVETAYVTGATLHAERAAGMTLNSLRGFLAARGLDVPVLTGAERGRLTADGSAASKGDEQAIARIAAREAHARAVYDVCLRALALVPDQPAHGRFNLPTPSPELVEALRDCDPKAVVAVFPGLVPAPVESRPLPPQPQKVQVMSKNHGRVRLVPPDDEIRTLLDSGTPTAASLATAWGVTTSTVYANLRRLGLTLSRTPGAAPVRAPEVEAPAPPAAANIVPFQAPTVAVPESIAVIPQPGQPRFLGRLDVDGIAAAIELSRRTGLDPLDALTWTRADAAIAMREAPRPVPAIGSEARG